MSMRKTPVSRQRSALSSQLSALSSQLSVLSSQLSVLSVQPSTSSVQRPAYERRLVAGLAVSDAGLREFRLLTDGDSEQATDRAKAFIAAHRHVVTAE